MKKAIIISLVLFFTIFAFNACNNKSAEVKAEQKENPAIEKTAASTEKAKYICPMCADVKSDNPGKCPTCGMELEENR